MHQDMGGLAKLGTFGCSLRGKSWDSGSTGDAPGTLPALSAGRMQGLEADLIPACRKETPPNPRIPMEHPGQSHGTAFHQHQEHPEALREGL